MNSIKKPLSLLALLIPSVIAAYWSLAPAMSSLLACLRLPKVEIPADLNQPSWLNTKREIQRHFLKQNVYIPLEDIALARDSSYVASQGSMAFINHLLFKSCSSANLLIWVPLRIRLPIIGEHVLDLCWKLDNG